MKDKVAVLMEETGCDRGEAELALELCGYDLEGAAQAIPRLFQNIVVLKARMVARSESLYGLWLVILNLKDRSLMRARAVLSYNPAVFASELDRHWFDFEARLYACRLWAGTMQALSQETEQLLSVYFRSPAAARFYEEGRPIENRDFAELRSRLSARLGELELHVKPDILDMGQFQEVRPAASADESREAAPKRPERTPLPGSRSGNLLVLRVSLQSGPEGIPASELRAGDMVYAAIHDQRDIAQYLARLFGARSEEGLHPVLVPVEAVERQRASPDRPQELMVRVRFSAGVCGDATVPDGVRLKAVQRPSNVSWWKKIFGS